MKNTFVFYTVWFVALIVAQILVFNQFELGFGIHVMVYPDVHSNDAIYHTTYCIATLVVCSGIYY
jgi:hypothetical protein